MMTRPEPAPTAAPLTATRVPSTPRAGSVAGPTSAEASSAMVWAALLTVYLVWGSTYLGIRIAVGTIPPFLMGTARFALAGGALLGWAALRGQVRPRPSLREVRDSTIVGGLLLLGGMGLVAVGEQTLSSGIAALLVATMPLWLAVLGRVLFGEHLPLRAVVGIFLGFVGVIVLAWPAETGAIDPQGLAVLLCAPVFWSLGTLYARRARLPSQPVVSTALQMLGGGALLGVAATVTGELGRVHPKSVSGDSLIALAYLAVVGSIVGFSAFAWLVRNAPLPLVSTYAYVNPAVAVILGALILNEPFGPRILVAGAIIVAAVVIIVSARGRQGSREH